MLQCSKPMNTPNQLKLKLNLILMIHFVVTYSWDDIRSYEVLSKNEEEVATKRSMKNLKMAMHMQR